MMDPVQVFEAHLLSRNNSLHVATKHGDSEVQQFYDGRTVFITGGSGFLGKQLIEKLLRATNVSKIFMLIRSKKGKLIEDRLREILENPLYDLLRRQKPKFEQKLVPIPGDVTELRLGMSDEDWNTVISQTEIIFHVAATTRFDEALRNSTLINVRGTRETLVLGTECSQLKSFVHISTAYAHVKIGNDQVLENFYQSPVDPEALLKLIESTEETKLRDITPNLIKGWPNTYTFTKAVAEELVRIMGRNLPLCIVRPAVVIGAYREPYPGWLDMSNIYGVSGFVLGTALGVLHALYMKHDVNGAYVPVDYVNNATIVAAWETAKKQDMNLKIYSVTPSIKKKITMGEATCLLTKMQAEYNLPDSIGYCFLLTTSNPILYFIYTLLTQTIPGYMIDAVLLIWGRKRMAVKKYKKVTKMIKALSFFMLNDIQIDDKNLVELYLKLSRRDQEIFEFDMKTIDWPEFMKIWGMGIRKYIVKDGLTRTNYGNKKQFVFRLLLLFIMPFYFYMLYKVIYLGIVGLRFSLYGFVYFIGNMLEHLNF